jgi:hypothetical protein
MPLGHPIGRGLVEEQVAMILAQVQDRDPQVVTVVLQLDVVARRLGGSLNGEVQKETHQTSGHDRQRQTADR